MKDQFDEHVERALGHIDKLHGESHNQAGKCEIAACIVAAALREQVAEAKKLNRMLVSKLVDLGHAGSVVDCCAEMEKK